MAGQSPVEAVAANRQPAAEAAVHKVTAVAVVEPIVLDDDVVRAAIQRDAVGELGREVAAVREDAPVDPNMVRGRHEDRRAEARLVSGHDQIVQVDAQRSLKLERGIAADWRDRQPTDRDVTRSPEQEASDAHAATADDPKEPTPPRAEYERRVRTGPQDDRPPATAKRSSSATELLGVRNNDRPRTRGRRLGPSRDGHRKHQTDEDNPAHHRSLRDAPADPRQSHPTQEPEEDRDAEDRDPQPPAQAHAQ